MAIAAQTPDILGDRQSGQDVRTQNGEPLLLLPLDLPLRLHLLLRRALLSLYFSIASCLTVRRSSPLG